jgi:hypothetical protein
LPAGRSFALRLSCPRSLPSVRLPDRLLLLTLSASSFVTRLTSLVWAPMLLHSKGRGLF